MTPDIPPQRARFGEFVRSLRQEADLTLYELEKRSRISRSTLMRIENGEHARPNTSTLNRLAHGLDIDPERLYDAVWDQAEDPLPSPAVYFRSKYRLNAQQIEELERSLEAMTDDM